MRLLVGRAWWVTSAALAGVMTAELVADAPFSPAFAANSAANGPTHLVPLFPAASDAALQGFVRVVNRSGDAGEVQVDAIDDTGVSYGPLTLSIDGHRTAHFNSDDLEAGNAGKSLRGSTGAGEGDWRLTLTSDLDLEVLSYIRTRDGFLTAMHDLAPVTDGVHRIVIFNPGSNTSQVSRLRLLNTGEEEAQVIIEGTDDRGMSPGNAVEVTVVAGCGPYTDGGGTRVRWCRHHGRAGRRRRQVAPGGHFRSTDPCTEPAVEPDGAPDEPVDGAFQRGGRGARSGAVPVGIGRLRSTGVRAGDQPRGGDGRDHDHRP